MKAGRREVEVSNPDKVLFPGEGYTKSDIIKYYVKVSDQLLAYTRGRPIVMQRYPDGIGGKSFYQKQAPDYFPQWIETVRVEKRGKGGEEDLVVAEDEATLAYLANQASITMHTWLSKKPHLDEPDQLVFDLDPPGEGFSAVKEAAKALKQSMDCLDLKSFVKLTGSKGVHVVVPLTSERGFDAVRAFAKKVAEETAAEHPKDFTTEQRKSSRKGRVFLDYLRNSYAQTVVAPYSVRAREGAPVAFPIKWADLSKTKSAKKYTLKNALSSISRRKDPWKAYRSTRQGITDEHLGEVGL